MTDQPAPDRIPLRRALVSVYDKTGLDELARGLHDAGVEIVSTGRPPRASRDARRAGDARSTSSPASPSPRRPGQDAAPARCTPACSPTSATPTTSRSSTSSGIEPFQLRGRQPLPVPRDRRVAAPTPDECIEQIDIGGPAMVRAAAKNHALGRRRHRPGALRRRARRRRGRRLRPRRSASGWRPRRSAHTAAYDVAVASLAGQRRRARRRVDGTRLPGLDRRDLRARRGAALRREPAPARGALRRHRRRRARRRPSSCTARRCATTTTSTPTPPGAPPTTSTSRASRSSSTPTRAASRSAPTSPRRTARRTPATRSSAFGGVIATNRPVTRRDGRAGRRDLHRGDRRARRTRTAR